MFAKEYPLQFAGVRQRTWILTHRTEQTMSQPPDLSRISVNHFSAASGGLSSLGAVLDKCSAILDKYRMYAIIKLMQHAVYVCAYSSISRYVRMTQACITCQDILPMFPLVLFWNYCIHRVNLSPVYITYTIVEMLNSNAGHMESGNGHSM